MNPVFFVQVCMHCTGAQNASEIRCVSLDCSTLYKSFRAAYSCSKVKALRKSLRDHDLLWKKQRLSSVTTRLSQSRLRVRVGLCDNLIEACETCYINLMGLIQRRTFSDHKRSMWIWSVASWLPHSSSPAAPRILNNFSCQLLYPSHFLVITARFLDVISR